MGAAAAGGGCEGLQDLWSHSRVGTSTVAQKLLKSQRWTILIHESCARRWPECLPRAVKKWAEEKQDDGVLAVRNGQMEQVNVERVEVFVRGLCRDCKIAQDSDLQMTHIDAA